jgi:hypothetical protein
MTTKRAISNINQLQHKLHNSKYIVEQFTPYLPKILSTNVGPLIAGTSAVYQFSTTIFLQL